MIRRIALYRGVLDEVEKIENLVWSESRNDPTADNGEDRGLVMINRKYNPDVTDKQAFNPEFSINFFIDAIEREEEWKWTPCSCVSTAQVLTDFDVRGNADSFQVNSIYPVVGGLAIFNYGTNSHVAVVKEVRVDGILVREGNYQPCLIDYRLVSWDDPNLVGFYFTEDT